MIKAAGSPEMAVQWKMVDQYKGIAEAQAHALEHIQLGNVTVYGSSSTGAEFAKSFIEKFSPALDIINSGVKDQFKDLFGIGKGNKELTSTEEKETSFDEGFEEVKQQKEGF